VDALLAAHRRQTIDDALRRQRMHALATDLSDPAAALTWWLDQKGADWNTLPTAETLDRVAGLISQYRHTRDQPLEYQLLEMLRSFLSSFPDDPQKQLLIAMMARGMRAADRPLHAAPVEALLNGHTPTAPAHD
jgi:hypothetical protein